MSDADLVKELRQQARNRTERFGDGSESVTAEWRAADRIEALAAEVERLRLYTSGDWASQRDNDALTIEMYGWKDRAESAERALTDYTRHEQTLRDNGIPSHSHAVVMICDLRRALAEAIEIMRRIDADFSGPRVTVHDGNAFSHFQELNRQSVAIRTAARDFITAQEKEKGK